MDIFEFCHHSSFWAKVDSWYPLKQDEIFKQTKNAIILPVSKFFNLEEKSMILDNFMLTPKRCYNSKEIRNHICRYLNYFERFYDKEHELLFYMYSIKFRIDIGTPVASGVYNPYTLDEFLYDIKTYILSESMYRKTWLMVEHNYELELNYKNKTNEGLQYADRHGKYLMEISLFQNILIPIVMHYVYKNKIMSSEVVNDLLFNIYNWLIDVYTNKDIMDKRGLQPADIYSKLYETSITTMNSHYKTNKTLWDISNIRGFCPTINANDAVNTVLMQVMPKYTFEGNMITYNISSVRNNIKYNIDIKYEYDYIPLSSSKRDGEDNTSQLDKYENHCQKTDEELILQNHFRANKVMDMIINFGGYVSQDEIDFYRKELTRNGQYLVNRFQQNLVNNMFSRFFGDTVSINSINGDQYIALIVIAKRILLRDGMILLPYIISSSIIRISTRTSLCKKELMKIEQSEYYNDLLKKYNGNEKIVKQFFSLVATTLSSGFKIIDYDNPDNNGKEVVMESDIIIDELLRFILAV